jgi:hypothetical protein
MWWKKPVYEVICNAFYPVIVTLNKICLICGKKYSSTSRRWDSVTCNKRCSSLYAYRKRFNNSVEVRMEQIK